MDLAQQARQIRKKILQMHHRANSSHVGSALSCLDLLVALYFDILKIDPQHPAAPERDRFILSKGHAARVLYATLAAKGFFSPAILDGYCQDNGQLPGHVTRGYVSGVEASTGSLGHGLAMGVGMALAARFDKLDYKTFVLLSDGECDEGSTWEAALLAAHKKLSNLVAIIDYNKIQSFGRTQDVINLEPFKDKWASFGWSVKEINGHNFDEIRSTFKTILFAPDKPSVVIAHTVKGKGVSFMEDKLEWHYKAPNREQLEAALKELDAVL